MREAVDLVSFWSEQETIRTVDGWAVDIDRAAVAGAEAAEG